MVLIGVLRAVYFHFVVRFCMVCGALSCCYGCASTMFDGCVQRDFWGRRGLFPLVFFYHGWGVEGCVDDEVDMRHCFIIITYGSGWSCMDVIVVRLFPVTSTPIMAVLASMLWKWVSVLDIIDIRLATVMNCDFLAVSVVCVCQAWFWVVFSFLVCGSWVGYVSFLKIASRSFRVAWVWCICFVYACFDGCLHCWVVEGLDEKSFQRVWWLPL